MARVVIPANSWVEIISELNLSYNVSYETSNEGNSVLQVVTTEAITNAPIGEPYSLGVQQAISGIESWLNHKAANGEGIWVYSHNLPGQLEVHI